MRFTLKRKWEDDDGMLEIEVYFAYAGYAATQDIYVYPSQLSEFGAKLESFPSSIQDEVILEIGSTDEKWYCWLKLRAYVYDLTGHSALEFSVQSNGAVQERTRAQFSAKLEVASLNELGKQISNWAGNNLDPLEFERDID